MSTTVGNQVVIVKGCLGPSYADRMSRSGADLALLLLAGFRTLADRAAAELAERGYEDVRPVHDFALHSILSGADSASELARRMSVTRQAAAKTIATLEERGYVERRSDPADGRMDAAPCHRARARTAAGGRSGLRRAA